MSMYAHHEYTGDNEDSETEHSCDNRTPPYGWTEDEERAVLWALGTRSAVLCAWADGKGIKAIGALMVGAESKMRRLPEGE